MIREVQTVANIDIHSLTPARLNDYLRFFETRAFADNADWSRCYCYFPYCALNRSAWDTRTAAENRVAICDHVVSRRAHGYLAYAADDVVGWCNAGPYASFPILNDLLEITSEQTGAIVCFVVCPEHRGKGIAKQLLGAACDGLKAQGMRAVVAKPCKGATGTAENFPGPLAMYIAAGFAPIREDGKGNVLVRKQLK